MSRLERRLWGRSRPRCRVCHHGRCIPALAQRLILDLGKRRLRGRNRGRDRCCDRCRHRRRGRRHRLRCRGWSRSGRPGRRRCHRGSRSCRGYRCWTRDRTAYLLARSHGRHPEDGLERRLLGSASRRCTGRAGRAGGAGGAGSAGSATTGSGRGAELRWGIGRAPCHAYRSAGRRDGG